MNKLDPKSDPKTAYEYCLKKGCADIDAEEIIIRENEYILKYALNVLKGRWRKAEIRMHSQRGWHGEYACQVMKARWPEAERMISCDWLMSRIYSKKFFNGRWEACEKTAEFKLTRAVHYSQMVSTFKCEYSLHKFEGLVYGVFRYIRDNYGRAWPAAYEIINADPRLCAVYSEVCLKGPSAELESIILTCDGASVYYLINVKKCAWAAFEHIALKTPSNALAYAEHGLEDRFIEGEAMIMSDAQCAHQYARNVMKSEWPEAESTILSAPYVALCYALDIKHERWLEAEDMIRESEYKSDYEKHFNCEL